eukprot:Ihof_evm1s1078 gene=Ihof_evmTU1s1078
MDAKVFVLSAILALAAEAVPLTGQNLANTIASKLQVKVGVDTNHPAHYNRPDVNCQALGADWATCGVGKMDFTYTGTSVTDKKWEIYFHSIRRILNFDSTDYRVEFLTGDLHKMVPTDSFISLESGNFTIPYVYEFWNLFETDFIPVWWVSTTEGERTYSVVPNTNIDQTGEIDKFVYPITGNEWMRTLDSPLLQSNVTTRYDLNSDTTVLPAQDFATKIIPTPLTTTVLTGEANLLQGIKINAVGISAEQLTAAEDHFIQLGISKSDQGYVVDVSINPVGVPDIASKAEGYTLRVTSDGAVIVGFDVAGALHGLQSLASLVTIGKSTIHSVEVVDAPRFGVRSMFLDIARNFHTPAAVKRLLNQMAAYKLNRLHFHLSDDEGWRLEIPGLPELTEVGSKRCMDLTEATCLLPQLGSGPTTDNFGSGFLTRAQYIDILKYADAHGIEVFPEFDMPGHARAAVIAMEQRYNSIMASTSNAGAANEYRLTDPDDTSVFLSTQFYDRMSQINTCMPGATAFITKLVAEVFTMHQDAGVPLKRWHFGGDEAHNIFLGSGYVDKSASEEEKKGKGEIDMSQQTKPFDNSPACTSFMNTNGLTSTNELIGYLAKEMSKVLQTHGINDFMAWQDGMKLVDSNQLDTPNNVLNFWDTLFWGGAESVFTWASKGYKVVLSCPDYLYFDFPQENNPKESGYYWAGRDQTVRRLFNFAPQNLAQNAETSTDRDGKPFTATSVEIPDGKTIEDVIVGMQGHVWSEIIRTDEQMDYMTYPRLLALDERAWHKASWELDHTLGHTYNDTTTYVDKAAQLADWNVFSNIVAQRELPKLDTANVHYRVPVPGATADEGNLKMNVELPGLPLYMSLDGTNFNVLNSTNAVLPADANVVYVKAGLTSHTGRAEAVTVH